jgi:hypothetical protein
MFPGIKGINEATNAGLIPFHHSTKKQQNNKA